MNSHLMAQRNGSITDEDVQRIPVFVSQSGISLDHGPGALQVTGQTAAALNDEIRENAPGVFDVFVFDSERRARGFFDGVQLLRERDDDVSALFSRELQDSGLSVVVVWSRDWEEMPSRWTDLRGEREMR